jgi:ribosomal protein S12 methylthiotransferase
MVSNVSNTNLVPRVGFVSLGCPKATSDSERILTQLRAEGYVISADYHQSDFVIVNTCGFIDEAVAESLEAIRTRSILARWVPRPSRNVR